MPYSIRYENAIDCIFVLVEGELNLSLFKNMAAEAAQFIEKHGCRRILSDLTHATMPKTIVDVYNMPRRAINTGVSRSIRRALVVGGNREEFQFLETVFLNQGNVVKLFSDNDKARRWLLDDA